MKKYLLMVTITALSFGTQVNAMDQKRKEAQFRSFLDNMIYRNNMPDVPVGEDPGEFVVELIRDGATKYGLHPAQARRIYRDFSLDFRLLVKGVERTNPNFNELKAQLARQYGPQIEASVLEVFPED